MSINYIDYLPEHRDELELLDEAYIEYFIASLSLFESKNRLTENEFIFNRASPELLKALKGLEVKLKKRQIDEDFKA